MPIKPLDKETADAVCTVIAIGFMAEQLRITNEDQRTIFLYENQNDKTLHDKLRCYIMRNAGIYADFTKIEPSSYQQPFIFAKRPISHKTIFKTFENTQKFWAEMDENSEVTEPQGAYIGGVFHKDGVTIVGPSSLIEYAPAFRTCIDNSIPDQYSTIEAEIRHAFDCVYFAEEKYPEGIKHESDNLIRSGGLKKNTLFGCTHGMVRAMLKYPNLQEEEIHFEYSLGPKTTKVASCIPCSIFMSANGHSASATHLGRGDSWNFPNPNLEIYPQMEEQTERWGLTVIQHFFNGRDLLIGVMDTNPALFSLNQVEIADNIPQLFLESLTFHDSFLNRMLRTLTPR